MNTKYKTFIESLPVSHKHKVIVESAINNYSHFNHNGIKNKQYISFLESKVVDSHSASLVEAIIRGYSVTHHNSLNEGFGDKLKNIAYRGIDKAKSIKNNITGNETGKIADKIKKILDAVDLSWDAVKGVYEMKTALRDISNNDIQSFTSSNIMSVVANLLDANGYINDMINEYDVEIDDNDVLSESDFASFYKSVQKGDYKSFWNSNIVPKIKNNYRNKINNAIVTKKQQPTAVDAKSVAQDVPNSPVNSLSDVPVTPVVNKPAVTPVRKPAVKKPVTADEAPVAPARKPAVKKPVTAGEAPVAPVRKPAVKKQPVV